MTRAPEPPPRLRAAIDTLLRRRSELLLAYTGLLSLDDDEVDRLPGAVQRLNQLLTDYSALWHFELMDSARWSAEARAAAADHLACIDRTTDRFLDFGDRFAPDAGPVSLNELCLEMEGLAEALAERFEAEDRALVLLSSPAAVAG